MTAADRTCPRARAARGGERHCHIKTPSTALYFRRKQHEVCCARTGTGTGGNHQKYGTVTQPRLKQVALSAISEVNAELYEFRRRQQMLGYASLAEVPAEQLDGKSERIQHYFNAVYCWARAMLNERYQDYDATASGVKRGEELAEASGDLWRDARWAISRVQDAPHCTVELI